MQAEFYAPLRHPLFRRLWFAGLTANIGLMLQSVAASWLMTSLSASTQMVALVQASATFPIVLLSLSAGAIADTYDRRAVMLLSQLFIFISMVMLAAVTWAQLVTPALLLTLVFLTGCGSAMYGPAWQASVGDQVPRTELSSAVAINGMSLHVARSVGPAVGGLLLSIAGVVVALIVSAASNLGLILVLFGWRLPSATADVPRESLGSAMMTGVRYAMLSPRVLLVLVRSFVFGVGASAIPALMAPLAKENLAGGVLEFGVLLGGYGAGAVVAAISSPMLRARYSTETLVKVSSVAFGISNIVAAASTNSAIVFFALLPAGAGWVVALSSLNLSIQMSTPRWVVARVLSLFQMVTFAGIAAGSWLWGLTAAHSTITVALSGAAFTLFVCGLVGLWIPVLNLEDVDLSPRDGWLPPVTSVPLHNRSGPMVISLEWTISDRDASMFVALMAERRRICSRNGAADWLLMRDVENSDVWIERYKTGTWSDYIRLNKRLTRNDATHFARLCALEANGHPTVRRMVVVQPGSSNESAASGLVLSDPRQSI